MSNGHQMIRNYFKDDLFVRNRSAASKRNNTFVRAILITAMICYVFLFIMSFGNGGYAEMRKLYVTLLIVFLVLLTVSLIGKEKTASPVFYIFICSFVGLCTYSSSFIFPDSVSVMVLLALFGFPALLIDKNWRVNAVSILMASIYLIITSFYKTSASYSEELLNVICFTLFGCIVGGITRKAQLQNFDTMDKLRISREQYRIAMEHSNEIICEFDVARRCIIMEPEAAKLYHETSHEYSVPYEPINEGLIDKDSINTYVDFFESIIRGDRKGKAEFLRRTAEGWRWQNATFTTIFSDEGKPLSAIISFVDVTEQRMHDAAQKRKAEMDGLTGIYNRETTEAIINQALAEDAQGALMLIDLDDFKAINDSLGHPQGDITLRAVANILKNRFRQTDVVGRIGGDEFAVFMKGKITQATVSDIVDKLMPQIREYRAGEHGERRISVSIGIALQNEEGLSFDALYKRADVALYSAKGNGKNQYTFYVDGKGIS